jgi:hypothetical protein
MVIILGIRCLPQEPPRGCGPRYFGGCVYGMNFTMIQLEDLKKIHIWTLISRFAERLSEKKTCSFSNAQARSLLKSEICPSRMVMTP